MLSLMPLLFTIEFGWMSRSLQCIVFMKLGREKNLPRSDDERFVALRQIRCFEDWLRGATIGEDYWWLAERFIVAKRAGEGGPVVLCVFVGIVNGKTSFSFDCFPGLSLVEGVSFLE
ncbi:hypothetical protein R3P38DRAFT_1777234 [Favolaschia claudopus]|uniref:Uncharacterized protein n=1 Tax=Favolaschia claudopus TaxID=2862362 RepID=A0AAW0A768_9AGAR